MRLSVTYKPYTLVAVPFPFTNSAQTKKRPAVVISSEHHQTKTGHISLLMITTAKHSNWYDDHPIIDLTSAGLDTPSIIRQKLFTIDSRLVMKKIGALNKEDQKKVTTLLQQHLCL
ncbi:MAG: type II toxin-antitoxin system PemK/MazF family toxin [Proteobacteria bacterium]|nr:type II toxin-antitoxin system PemK/MazF family toxin [Pseudomonadota bacterium]